MKKEEVMVNIRTINSGSAGCSMRVIVASYYLLDYVCNNKDYKEISKLIYKYYNEEYDSESSLTTNKGELEYLLSTCCTLILVGDKLSLDYVELTSKNYSDKDVSNFLKFANLINEKFNYELELDSINGLQLQRNLMSQEQLEKTIKHTEVKMEDLNERIDKIHFDTISIISIFVAVIFALYGGTQLVSSTINRISSDNYKLMFKTALILGYVLFSLISALLSVMTWHDKRSNKKWTIIILNVLFATVVVLSWTILK